MKDPNLIENIFDFGRSIFLENAFLSVWFASIRQYKYSWYNVVLWNFERKDLFSFAVSQNEINLTNRLRTNANLRYFRIF